MNAVCTGDVTALVPLALAKEACFYAGGGGGIKKTKRYKKKK